MYFSWQNWIIFNFCFSNILKGCKKHVHLKFNTLMKKSLLRKFKGLFDLLSSVPEQCQFDHIHNQSRCWSFSDWNSTAVDACNSRQMILRSFAILLPCGIDLFSGVEFVCCPTSVKQLIQAGFGEGDIHDNDQVKFR